jgi:Domain of unknown function (DUF4288)
MKWYLAKIIFNININDGFNQRQFDEQLRLIEAHDFEEALQMATEIGIKEEKIFTNNKNETVHWKFIDVMELQIISEFKHGIEIYSNTHFSENFYDYIKFVKQKSNNLQSDNKILA